MTILLFSEARERAGAATATVALPPGATVADLRAALAAQVPALGAVLAVSRIAVNQEFAGDTDVIPSGAEVAVLPPVSGG